MALKGLLLQDGCADVFQLLGRQNKSGVLKLRNPPAAVDIWLTNGMVVRVEDRGRDVRGRLGELLVRAGFLSRPALLEALGVQQRTGKRMGHVLLEGRYVPQQVLADFIKLQARETLFNVFMMRSGTYEFIGGAATTMAPELRPGLKWEHALMEGIRRTGEWPEIRKYLPSNHYSLRAIRDLSEAPPPRAPVDDEANFLGLDDDGTEAGPAHNGFPNDQDRLVFALIRPGVTVQRIIDQSYLGEFEACRIVSNMVQMGYLEVLEEEHELSDEDADVMVEEEAPG